MLVSDQLYIEDYFRTKNDDSAINDPVVLSYMSADWMYNWDMYCSW